MPKRKTRNDDEMNISGATIKKIRLERGLTQAQLGARMETQGMLWGRRRAAAARSPKPTVHSSIK